jgi:hypothetical protein
MLVSSRLALEALEAIGQYRETGWAVAVRALVAIANSSRATPLCGDKSCLRCCPSRPSEGTPATGDHQPSRHRRRQR